MSRIQWVIGRCRYGFCDSITYRVVHLLLDDIERVTAAHYVLSLLLSLDQHTWCVDRIIRGWVDRCYSVLRNVDKLDERFSVQKPHRQRALMIRYMRQKTPLRCCSVQGRRNRVVPIVILPGFLNTEASYTSLARNLETWIHQKDQGYTADVRIVQVSLKDWLRVILGADLKRAYLDRLEEVVTDLHETYDGEYPVRLVGHSAGGWIARLFLGNVPYQHKKYSAVPKVSCLVTLGTPHQSTENYPFGKFDEKLDLPPGITLERMSSLQFCNYFYPRGNEFEGVRVVCVAGDAIQGQKTLSLNLSNLDNVLAYQAYKAVCGDGTVTGDSVTPVCIALLDKAYENIVLPGVWHYARQSRLWYGDLSVLDEWAHHLLLENFQT